MEINKEFVGKLIKQAEASPRLRHNYDLRTSSADGSQRMLNALMPGTKVPIHRHPMSNENVILLCGKLIEVIYEEDPIFLSCRQTQDITLNGNESFENGVKSYDDLNGRRLKEIARYTLDLTAGNLGCVVPAGVWHTVEVLEPSVIYEAKDGKYGEDGTESL